MATNVEKEESQPPAAKSKVNEGDKSLLSGSVLSLGDLGQVKFPYKPKVVEIDTTSTGEIVSYRVNTTKLPTKTFLAEVSDLPKSLDSDPSELCKKIFELMERNFGRYDSKSASRQRLLGEELKEITDRFSKETYHSRSARLFCKLSDEWASSGNHTEKQHHELDTRIQTALARDNFDSSKIDFSELGRHLHDRAMSHFDAATDLWNKSDAVMKKIINNERGRELGHDVNAVVNRTICGDRASLVAVALRSRGVDAGVIGLPYHAAVILPVERKVCLNYSNEHGLRDYVASQDDLGRIFLTVDNYGSQEVTGVEGLSPISSYFPGRFGYRVSEARDEAVINLLSGNGKPEPTFRSLFQEMLGRNSQIESESNQRSHQLSFSTIKRQGKTSTNSR